MSQPDPDLPAQFRTALQKFADQAAHAGHILATQAAMGWIYRGDLDKARDVLAKLPPDALQQVAVAAAALATLADEVAANPHPGSDA